MPNVQPRRVRHPPGRPRPPRDEFPRGNQCRPAGRRDARAPHHLHDHRADDPAWRRRQHPRVDEIGQITSGECSQHPLSYRQNHQVFIGDEAIRAEALQERIRRKWRTERQSVIPRRRQRACRTDGLFDRLKAAGVEKSVSSRKCRAKAMDVIDVLRDRLHKPAGFSGWSWCRSPCTSSSPSWWFRPAGFLGKPLERREP